MNNKNIPRGVSSNKGGVWFIHSLLKYLYGTYSKANRNRTKKERKKVMEQCLDTRIQEINRAQLAIRRLTQKQQKGEV